MSCTIFENAGVFDGINPDVTEPMYVRVDGNEITEISAQPIRADGADRIDCRKKTLMPGLIDNHVHIYLDSLRLNPPEPPVTYRAQYAQKFLRHILCAALQPSEMSLGVITEWQWRYAIDFLMALVFSTVAYV